MSEFETYPDETRQMIAQGVSELTSVEVQLQKVDQGLDSVIARVRAVTHGTRSDAPGRALNNLHQAKDSVSNATDYLKASAELAEHWSGSL